MSSWKTEGSANAQIIALKPNASSPSPPRGFSSFHPSSGVFLALAHVSVLKNRLAGISENPQTDDGIARSFETSIKNKKSSARPPAGMARQPPHLTLPRTPFKQHQPPTQSSEDGWRRAFASSSKCSLNSKTALVKLSAAPWKKVQL